MRRIALIGAAIALLTVGATPAFAQEGKPKHHDEQDKHDKQAKGEEKKGEEEHAGDKDRTRENEQSEQRQQQALRDRQAAETAAAQQRDAQQQAQAQANQQAAQQQAQANEQAEQQMRVSQVGRQQRVARQQARTAEYQRNLDLQLRAVQEQNALLQRNRATQYQIQQEYSARLRQQQLQIQSERNDDYDRDPYFNSPWSVRYSLGGQSRRTNQYGADLLRQAVRYGYEEGVRAGNADRRDHWRYNSRDSFAYRDANYGYTGHYVEQSDYNYYFRQGFRKGYEDGYYSRARYGRQSNGNPTILQVVLSELLNLQNIR
jgi:hypothetical protein